MRKDRRLRKACAQHAECLVCLRSLFERSILFAQLRAFEKLGHWLRLLRVVVYKTPIEVREAEELL